MKPERVLFMANEFDKQYAESREFIISSFNFFDEAKRTLLRLMGVDPEGLTEWELERAVNLPKWFWQNKEFEKELVTHYGIVREYERERNLTNPLYPLQ
jgi:hypothetical protein